MPRRTASETLLKIKHSLNPSLGRVDERDGTVIVVAF